eukprot:1189027-Prorocentrum_minimum.AAC.2
MGGKVIYATDFAGRTTNIMNKKKLKKNNQQRATSNERTTTSNECSLTTGERESETSECAKRRSGGGEIDLRARLRHDSAFLQLVHIVAALAVTRLQTRRR